LNLEFGAEVVLEPMFAGLPFIFELRKIRTINQRSRKKCLKLAQKSLVHVLFLKIFLVFLFKYLCTGFWFFSLQISRLTMVHKLPQRQILLLNWIKWMTQYAGLKIITLKSILKEKKMSIITCIITSMGVLRSRTCDFKNHNHRDSGWCACYMLC
jgi:hypothetical protein